MSDTATIVPVASAESDPPDRRASGVGHGAAPAAGNRSSLVSTVTCIHRPPRPTTTAPPRIDVAGIGNALVDVIAPSTEEFLVEHGLVKGSMTLVEIDRAAELYGALGTAVEMSGGSAANTMCRLASFGGRAAYIGKVDDDDLGQVFGHDMRAVGVDVPRRGRPPTAPRPGRCVIVVTPDAERTMNTYLGVSSLLGVRRPRRGRDRRRRGAVHGGLPVRPRRGQGGVPRAAEVAHANGRLVSLTLSDSFCVDRHRDDFRALVRDEVDLLFGNHDELLALYETDSFDEAIAAVRADCELAAITLGADGCSSSPPTTCRTCRPSR